MAIMVLICTNLSWYKNDGSRGSSTGSTSGITTTGTGTTGTCTGSCGCTGCSTTTTLSSFSAASFNCCWARSSSYFSAPHLLHRSNPFAWCTLSFPLGQCNTTPFHTFLLHPSQNTTLQSPYALFPVTHTILAPQIQSGTRSSYKSPC